MVALDWVFLGDLVYSGLAWWHAAMAVGLARLENAGCVVSRTGAASSGRGLAMVFRAKEFAMVCQAVDRRRRFQRCLMAGCSSMRSVLAVVAAVVCCGLATLAPCQAQSSGATSESTAATAKSLSVTTESDTVGQVGADAIAVCPAALQPSMGRWLQRRRDEGLSVHVIEPEASAEVTRQRIAEAASIGKTRYVVLIGDPQLTGDGRPRDVRFFVPAIYRRADATAAYQQTSHLPGDYLYGDFDSDGKVDAAVGRLPVRSVEQAVAVFQRIADYEESRDFGRWRSRVDLVAGLGGFGPLIDGAIETVASGMITGSLPGSVRTRVTHAGPESLFCPGPGCFTDTVLANYSDGARFWVYAGHGQVCELDRVPATRSGRPVLAAGDVENLRRPAGSAPIALMLACYTGAYDWPEDCLAKEMFLADGGPIAVLAGSRVTMPYGNAAAAMGLIHAVFNRQHPRLGDAWLDTLVEMATPSSSDPDLQARRGVIDGLATLLGGGRIDDERREHMQLYNWFGDPTLRLDHPQALTVDPPPRLVSGQSVTISGNAPMAGTLTVELHRRLGTVPANRSSVPNGVDPTLFRYQQANDTAVAMVQVPLVQPGPWTAGLFVPAEVNGPMRIVVDLESSSGFATGAQTVWIRPSAAGGGR